MISITLCSTKGSPGVTTLSCLLGAVWPSERAVLVAECDPSGGDLAGRFGLSTRIGMTSLVLTDRQGAARLSDYRAHAQQLPGGLDVLVAPTGADSAMALDHEIGMSSSELVSGECDLVADCGRLLPGAIGQEKMIRAADRVLLLVRPEVTGIAHARWATGRIRELSGSSPSVVIAGSGVHRPADVAQELDVKLLGVLPFDARAALMASGAPGTVKEFIRSGLVAFAREVVTALIDDLQTHPERGEGRKGRATRSREADGRRRLLKRLNPESRTSRSERTRHDERPRATSA